MKNIFTPLSIFFVMASCLVAPGAARGESLSANEALARYTNKNSAGVRKSASQYQLYFTKDFESAPAMYLYSTPGNNGFLLLSADDSTPLVLGYSDSCKLPSDESLLPPAFKYWMSTLARQVAYNKANNLHQVSQAVVGDPIEPLTATRWNQDLPFNYYCPMAGDKHCYTGCVATALAQVMKFHNFPATGKGTHSYGWKNPVTEVDTTLSFDYASTQFKWDLMQDRYDRDTEWNDKMAVAELMYACGVAVDMGYGPWSSGAGTNMIGPAMINYFGYDPGIRNYIRDYYGIDDWNKLVYDQLKNYGPVQYSGFADTDGHSFVIDGYDENGYFHVNWGWGGLSDGYFLLTALDPLEQGIGGAEQAFDFSQDFVGNVSIGGKSTQVYEQILLENAFGLEQTSAQPGDILNVWGGSFNYSVAPISNIMFGAMLIPEVGTDTLYLTGPEAKTLGIGEGVRPYEVLLPEDVPAGNYSLVPAFRDSSGNWRQIPVKIGLVNHYDAVSDGETIVFTKGAEASIVATDVVSPDKINLNEKFDVSATLKNQSNLEFFGSVCVALFDIEDTDMMMVKSDAVPVDVLPESTQDFKYQALFDPSDDSLKDGQYLLYICHVQNGIYNKISEPVTVTLGTTSVESINNSVNGSQTEYYTILGSRVNGIPSAQGIYIKVTKTSQGVKANKVYFNPQLKY